MRIAFLIYGSIEMTSGGFLYDRKLVEYLRAEGNHVDVIPLPWLDYSRSIHEHGKTAEWVIPALEKGKYDIILQDELAHPLLSLLNRRIRKLNIPVISIVHHLRCSEEQPPREKRRAALFEAAYLAGVDGFVLNSRATLLAVRNFRAAAGKSFVISVPGCNRFRDGFDPEAVRGKCAAAGPLRIIFVGILIPRKGLHVLIEALKHMPAGTWRLAVAGDPGFDPGYAAGIRGRVEDAKLGRHVDFLGPVADSDLAQLLRDSHLLVVPSSYEGFGIIYAEAMGFGVPAIGCRCGAVPELIDHGRNGFLVMPGDHKGLARHLLYLQENRSVLRDMSLAARETFQALPGWEEGLGRINSYLKRFVWTTS